MYSTIHKKLMLQNTFIEKFDKKILMDTILRRSPVLAIANIETILKGKTPNLSIIPHQRLCYMVY